MTPWMASTASAGVLKSGELETTPQIIARLRNFTCLPPLATLTSSACVLVGVQVQTLNATIQLPVVAASAVHLQ